MELLARQMETILLRASHIVLTNHSSVSFYKTSWLQFYLTFAYPGKKRTNCCFILLAYEESVKPHFLYAKSKAFRSRARGSDKATSNYRPSPVSLPECVCGSGKGRVALPLVKSLMVTEADFKASTFYSSGLFGFIVCQLSCLGGQVHTAASPAGAVDIGSGRWVWQVPAQCKQDWAVCLWRSRIPRLIMPSDSFIRVKKTAS